MKDLNCLKQIVQNLVECTQSSYNDLHVGLNSSIQVWYNCLSVYLFKKSQTGFEIIFVYVDDLNLVGTPEYLIETAKYSNNEFEIKNFGKEKNLSRPTD